MAYAIALSIAVLFYILVSNLSSYLGVAFRVIDYFATVIAGVVIAYVLNPLVILLQKRVFFKIKSPLIRKNISITCTVVAVIVFIVVLLLALVPQLIDSISTFISNLDVYAAGLRRMMRSFTRDTKDWSIDTSRIMMMGDDILERVTQEIPKHLGGFANTTVDIGKSIVQWIIAFILAIYFMSDKDHMVGGIRRLMKAVLPPRKYRISVDFWHRCNSILSRYVLCDLVDGLIIGVVNMIFMTIAGLPYAVLISVVVGVTNLAPTFGPILGGAIGAFILLLITPWYALWFIIFTIILQTIDGYILKPKMFGGLLGVPSVWILICIIVGGRIFAIPGILLAIPFAAISDYIYSELITRLESRRKLEAYK